MTQTYVFAFNPEPEGGYTVTCPALPGLVTYGETLDHAREMARDAMQGMLEVMLDAGERLPASESEAVVQRYYRLAQSLREESKAEPIFERLEARIAENV
jgi:predicted RNase H-like HicB family nuclease